MYEPGKILKSGTATDSGAPGNAAATAYVLDMTQPSPAWRQVASMAFPRALPQHDAAAGRQRARHRRRHGARRLRRQQGGLRGRAVVAGNRDVADARARAPFRGSIIGTALLLPDARVLVAGSGNDGPGLSIRRAAQIFSPPYLFKGARPAITSAPAIAQYGSTFTVDTPDAASIAKVSLIRPGAVTHSFDEDQRILSLSFTAGRGLARPSRRRPTRISRRPGTTCCSSSTRRACRRSRRSCTCPRRAWTSSRRSAPTGVSAEGGLGSATLTWTASTDNTGVALYNIHRSATPGFQPSAANRVGQADVDDVHEHGRRCRARTTTW